MWLSGADVRQFNGSKIPLVPIMVMVDIIFAMYWTRYSISMFLIYSVGNMCKVINSRIYESSHSKLLSKKSFFCVKPDLDFFQGLHFIVSMVYSESVPRQNKGPYELIF